jgi:hypothetical protein
MQGKTRNADIDAMGACFRWELACLKNVPNLEIQNFAQ